MRPTTIKCVTIDRTTNKHTKNQPRHTHDEAMRQYSLSLSLLMDREGGENDDDYNEK